MAEVLATLRSQFTVAFVVSSMPLAAEVGKRAAADAGERAADARSAAAHQS